MGREPLQPRPRRHDAAGALHGGRRARAAARGELAAEHHVARLFARDEPPQAAAVERRVGAAEAAQRARVAAQQDHRRGRVRGVGQHRPASARTVRLDVAKQRAVDRHVFGVHPVPAGRARHGARAGRREGRLHGRKPVGRRVGGRRDEAARPAPPRSPAPRYGARGAPPARPRRRRSAARSARTCSEPCAAARAAPGSSRRPRRGAAAGASPAVWRTRRRHTACAPPSLRRRVRARRRGKSGDAPWTGSARRLGEEPAAEHEQQGDPRPVGDPPAPAALRSAATPAEHQQGERHQAGQERRAPARRPGRRDTLPKQPQRASPARRRRAGAWRGR